MPTSDQLRIEAALDQVLAGHLSATDRVLVEAWARAWDQVRPEVEAAMVALAEAYPDGRVPYGVIRRDARLQAALAAVYGALDVLAERAPGIAASGLTAAVTASVAGNVDMIAAGLTGVLRADLRSSVLGADAGQVAAIIERSTQQITSRNRHLASDAQAAIRRELRRGIATGTNPRVAAARAVRGIEDQWNGGIARASTIARTEMIDAHRAAARRVQEANTDVLAGWEWVAHLGDRRVCRACLSQHATRHDVTEPGPLGHPNCRCARVPVTKTWAELGFTGMRDAVSKTPDADDWFDALPEVEQRAILTDAGWEKWKVGTWPRNQWGARRSTTGWRDSYQAVTPR